MDSTSDRYLVYGERYHVQWESPAGNGGDMLLTLLSSRSTGTGSIYCFRMDGYVGPNDRMYLPDDWIKHIKRNAVQPQLSELPLDD
jgi:hypothetical protein